MQNIKTIIRPFMVALGILVIPLIGNIYIDGWNWEWPAFIIFGFIFFGAGLVYELAGKYTKMGFISGFIFWELVAGSIIATLHYINPNEDVSGVVIITFLISGLFFAGMGCLLQKYFLRRKTK